MVRWHSTGKTAIVLGALVSLLIGSGAGVRWGDLEQAFHSFF